MFTGTCTYIILVLGNSGGLKCLGDKAVAD